MPRRILTLAVLSAAVALGSWGCQQYNFNPVGSCVIQPGLTQVTLSGTGTADILFVVDDSASMDPKQQALAQNFSTFIDELANAQKERVSAGLQPFEFHIAVTTSSIFLALPGTPPAITTTYPNPFPPSSVCTPGLATAGAPYPAGNFVAASGNPKVLHFTRDLGWAAWGVPAWSASTTYTVGQQTTNANNLYTCIAAGTSAGSGGPTTTATDITDGTVHWKYVSAVGPSVAALVKQFVGTCPTDGSICSAACTVLCTGGNVEVGSCGSGEEQHLEAGRLAIQKALAGTQPGLAPGEWPHADSKMVVIFVGDEDDCSNPQSNPVVLSGPTGADTCVADKNTNPPPSPRVYPDGVLEYPLSGSGGYEAFFSGLGRPFGAAFIVAANRCTTPLTYGDACAPADSSYVQSPASCTGTAQFACSVAYAAGVRHLSLARALEAKGISVVEGTVCENFGPILAAIADLVPPPSTLKLDSLPAAKDITILRIANSAGITQKVCTQRTVTGPPPLTCKGTSTTCTVGTELTLCGGPGLCGAYTAQGWWFADCADANSPPAVASSTTGCIYINHSAAGTVNDCEANVGETYSAEYLGRLPSGGCPSPTAAACAADASCTVVGGGCGTDGVCAAVGQCCGSRFCAQALPQSDGGASDPAGWWCYAPPGGTTGTCLCSSGP